MNPDTNPDTFFLLPEQPQHLLASRILIHMSPVAWAPLSSTPALISLALLLLAPPIHAGPPATQPAPPQAYLAECLFRAGGDVLCLGRAILRDTEQPLQVLGFDSEGKYVFDGRDLDTQAPDQRQRVPRDNSPPSALLSRTLTIARYGDKDVGGITITDWDVGLVMPDVREVSWICHDYKIWRLEPLTAQQAKGFRPLRQDRDFCRQRIEEISAEFLKRDMSKPDDRALSNALCALRAPSLLQEVRRRLAAWNTNPTNTNHLGLASLLAHYGDKDDLRWFESAIRQHPEYAGYLHYHVPVLLQRHGREAVRPLALAFLESSTGANARSDPGRELLLRDKGLPRPTVADHLLREWARAFRINPRDLGMVFADQLLLALPDQSNIPPSTITQSRNNVKSGSVEWIIPSQEARQRAIDRMKRWLSTGTTQPAGTSD